ncbi:MAG: TetR family transcriptional regulator [Pseudonocardiales bacterium]|nr:TetR/AcrR family transcriptional regulator [Actinomycetota bacterium]PZS21993.1 MAG: TetR family transcriptional regulator [Pseudonocardiales bacterium]
MANRKVAPVAAGPAARSGRARAAHLGPERRRPLILDAALEVYVERGYRGTSMQAVADAAGVTKPVVYECYPSKDELLLALLDREERRLMDAISESLPSNLVSDNTEAVLAAGFTAFLAGVGQAPNSWRVVFDSGWGSGSVVAARVRRVREMVVGQLRELVRQSMIVAEIDDIDRKAPVVAELITTVAESCARMLVLEHYPWTAAELATYVARLLARGVRPV